MNKIIINGTEISYLAKDEAYTCQDVDDRRLLKDSFLIVEPICKQLEIPCPDIGISSNLLILDGKGNISEQYARMYTPADSPALKSNVVIVSRKISKYAELIGVLAHEMRHVWQFAYHPEINKIPANGFIESLVHPAEIDADGYAIWYTSEFCGIDIEEAASIICPEEKEFYYKNYFQRISKANEIKTYFSKNYNCQDKTSSSFMSKIKQILRQCK